MHYIFLSNRNNYTLKKVDSLLSNMPEKDGLQSLFLKLSTIFLYIWINAAIVVNVNKVMIFEYTSTATGLECQFDYNLKGIIILLLQQWEVIFMRIHLISIYPLECAWWLLFYQIIFRKLGLDEYFCERFA